MPWKGESCAASCGDFIFVFVMGKGVLKFDPKLQTFTKSADLPLPEWFAFDVV